MELITRTDKQHKRIPGPFPKGRRCSEPDCDTILNQWHKGPACFACEPLANARETQANARENAERRLAQAA